MYDTRAERNIFSWRSEPHMVDKVPIASGASVGDVLNGTVSTLPPRRLSARIRAEGMVHISELSHNYVKLRMFWKLDRK